MSTFGLCECGCGGKPSIAKWTNKRWGHVKGQHVRFLMGHQRRKASSEYKVDPETGCWVWQLSRNQHGYGCMRDKQQKRQRPAHCIYYEQHGGVIADGEEVDHLCENRSCVNPAHLEAVTVTENRRRQGKLNWKLVGEIRELWRQGWGAADIARAYGITFQAVRAVEHRRIWNEAQV